MLSTAMLSTAMLSTAMLSTAMLSTAMLSTAMRNMETAELDELGGAPERAIRAMANVFEG
jgi:uncharacterized protein YjbI with pentapeptide repeats